MLIVCKFNTELLLVAISLLSSQRFEELLDGILDKQCTTHDTHDFNHRSAQFEIMFHNSNETVCNDSDMYLDSDSILRSAPKRFNLEMLLNPFKEQLHLPSVSVQKSDIIGFKIEVVCLVCERPLKFRSIVDNPAELCRIVVLVPLSCKTDSLVSEDIILSIKEVFSTDDLIVRLAFLPDNEEGLGLFNGEEPGKVKVAPVKNIASQWLVCNPVHSFGIMYLGGRNSVEDRYLRDDINLCVDSDARLCASEVSPLKHGHAEVNGSRVNCIESSMEFKPSGDSSLLSQRHHVEGKLFKDAIVSDGVRFGQSISCDRIFTKSKMIRSFSMCNCNIRKLTKTAATDELTKHQYQKMVPVRETPIPGSIFVLVDKSSEISLRQKHCKLSKEVMSGMHNLSILNMGAKVPNSNVGHTFLNLKCCA